MSGNSKDAMYRQHWIKKTLGFNWSYENYYGFNHEASAEPSQVFQHISSMIKKEHFKNTKGIARCDCPDSCESACRLWQAKVECPPSCGSKCKNQRIQREEFCSSLRLTSHEKFALCVTTTEEIAADALVVEVIGEICFGAPKPKQRMAFTISDRYSGDRPIIVNCSKLGNESRFFHHDPAPNCRLEEWVVNGRLRLVTVANSPIKPADIITLSLTHHIDSFTNSFRDNDIQDATVQMNMLLLHETSAAQILARADTSTNLCCYCKKTFTSELNRNRHLDRFHTAAIPDLLSINEQKKLTEAFPHPAKILSLPHQDLRELKSEQERVTFVEVFKRHLLKAQEDEELKGNTWKKLAKKMKK